MKTNTLLFGPFIGEASWEYFRFAPYMIFLRKIHKDHRIIVLTRESRFDLYGQWTDLFVPLRIKNERLYEEKAFKLLGYDTELYKRISDIFRLRYKKESKSVEHYYPDISSLRYKLKWQFPRDEMDYDFRPRILNRKVVLDMLPENDNLIVTDKTYTSDKYNTVEVENFKVAIDKIIKSGHEITYYGCLIELIKMSKFVISNLKSDLGRLAVLLKTPLIYPGRDISTDSVKLLNPENTPIIDCKNISEGVNIYENYV
jgi:hypothetical protein